MMQRVSYHFDASPILFVAPHGYKGDDLNSDVIAEKAAEHIGASYLINHGWQRSDMVDCANDKADCNNLNHMIEVVSDEFKKPFHRLCQKIKAYHGKCLVVFIHGISNNIRKEPGCGNVDMVFGYGQGIPKSLTCPEGLKNKFIYDLHKSNMECFVGKAGGKYSAFSKNNMNQYWRKYLYDEQIHSFQLEIIKELRDDETIAELTGFCLAEAAANCVNYETYHLPSSLIISYI